MSLNRRERGILMASKRQVLSKSSGMSKSADSAYTIPVETMLSDQKLQKIIFILIIGLL